MPINFTAALVNDYQYFLTLIEDTNNTNYSNLRDTQTPLFLAWLRCFLTFVQCFFV